MSDIRWNDARELAALEQFAPLAAAAGHLVLRRADRLLAAAARFDAHQVAVAGRGDEAEHAVLVRRSLIRMTPLPGPDR